MRDDSISGLYLQSPVTLSPILMLMSVVSPMLENIISLARSYENPHFSCYFFTALRFWYFQLPVYAGDTNQIPRHLDQN